MFNARDYASYFVSLDQIRQKISKDDLEHVKKALQNIQVPGAKAAWIGFPLPYRA